jgi:large subunit ribosomal protein L6
VSRVGKKSISIPRNVTITISQDNFLTVKGAKGELKRQIHSSVSISISNEFVSIKPSDQSKNANMQSGTARSLVNNMVIGVSQGFKKALVLTGVGYRAKAEGSKKLNLQLGFSHAINHELPVGVTAETPTYSDIVLKSIDKELLGKAASDIRNYRTPESYKGKGVCYVGEKVITKEAKKK